MAGKKLTHVDEQGAARMIDVGAKPISLRIAVARGEVRFGDEAFRLLREDRLKKGDALAVARIAGIQAAKRTDEWIPLCHSIPLEHLSLQLELHEATRTVRVRAEARARWSTGVEMEALVAVSAACLALYDMAKAVDRGITIREIRLLKKEGGQSGQWMHDTARPEEKP